MPTFHYRARTKTGELQSGVIEAGTREAALALLKQHRLIIVSLDLEESEAFFAKGLTLFKGRIKQKHVVLFARELAVLFAAGVPLVEALRTLQKEAETPALAEIVFAIAEDVNGGMPFSQAAEKHPKAFSTFAIMMMRSGEVSGRLQQSLNFLADSLEREYELSSKLKRSFMYPGFIFGMFVIIAGVLLVFVVPQLAKVFEETGQKLPLLTKVLIALSTLVRRYGWFVLPLLTGATVWGIRHALRTERGRNFWDWLKLKIPIFGNLWKKVYITRLTQNLGTLLESGISITQALEVAADVVGNVHYHSLLLEALERVKKGESLSSVFARSPLIPRVISAMVAIGEKSGKIDTIFNTVARFYQRELNAMIEGLVDLVEPLLIAIMGGGVGVLVASILLPIYRLASGI